jgi:transcriptional regulator with XRE-family HTH domain
MTTLLEATSITQSLDLSYRIRELRAEKGLKQSEVARRMRLDPSILSLWEQGKRLVPADRVPGLAEALETDVETLLSGVTNSPALNVARAAARASDELTRAASDCQPHAVALISLLDRSAATPYAPVPTAPEPVVPSGPPPPPIGSLAERRLTKPHLAWCDSSHGAHYDDGSAAPRRVHHHGWVPNGI